MSRIIEVNEEIQSVLLHRGREQFPFSLNDEGLKGLLNIHEGLVRKVLREGEVIKNILYSPICSVKHAPFEVQAMPASYAVVATEDRFIVTRNFHHKKILPQVYSIDFSDIASIELGKALLIGWLRIKFRYENKIEEIAIIFGATWGIDHFRRAVKVYLETQKIEPGRDALSKEIVIRGMAGWQKEQLALLFKNGLMIFSHINKPAIQVKRIHFVEENILLTEYGVIVVSDNGQTFLSGTNIKCIPYRCITHVKIEETGWEDVDLLELQLGDQFKFLFKTERKGALHGFVEDLRSGNKGAGHGPPTK